MGTAKVARELLPLYERGLTDREAVVELAKKLAVDDLAKALEIIDRMRYLTHEPSLLSLLAFDPKPTSYRELAILVKAAVSQFGREVLHRI